jgi:hypothetical protein
MHRYQLVAHENPYMIIVILSMVIVIAKAHDYTTDNTLLSEKFLGD